MSEELTQIEATAGPYRGQRLTVSKADAEAAIAEGWAIDPFAARPEGKTMTDEERLDLLAKAEAGARKLRGEKGNEAPGHAGEVASGEGAAAGGLNRDMAAERPASYRTKQK